MLTLNRAAIVVFPTQELVDWVNRVDSTGSARPWPRPERGLNQARFKLERTVDRSGKTGRDKAFQYFGHAGRMTVFRAMESGMW